MRSHAIPPVLAIPVLVVGLGLCHSARPVAVFAQASAVARVQARVVSANAAWTAQELAEAVLRSTATSYDRTASGAVGLVASRGPSPFEHPETTSGARSPAKEARWESGALVAWIERAPEGQVTLTVAHLGS